ncbi:glycosyltransferase family 2 protein [Acidisoma sp. 7E03]
MSDLPRNTPSTTVARASEYLVPVAQLNLEVRRLNARLRSAESLIDKVTLEKAQLSAAFAVALAEREKILASKTWRVARAIQAALNILRRILGPARKRGNPSSEPPHESRTHESSGAVAVHRDTTPSYHDWARASTTLSSTDRKLIVEHIKSFTVRPVISLVICAGGENPAAIETTMASIRSQLYPHWEFCLSPQDAVTGSFLAMLEPGDILGEEALFEIVFELQSAPELAVIYTDEDRINELGQLNSPMLKPAFSIDLALATRLTGALTIYRRSTLEAMGISAKSITSISDQELVVAVAAHSGASAIRHIPAILCHRAATNIDAAVTPDAATAAKRLATVASKIASVEVTPLPNHPQWNRVIWPLPPVLPRVSVIIPTRDKADLLTRSVLGVLFRTNYQNLEVIIVDNDSVDTATFGLFRLLENDSRVRIIHVPGTFNYSAMNNKAAREATGDILLLLNNDIDVIEPGWLTELVSHAVRPDVGAVGAKLLYADGLVQHAGVVLGVGEHNAGPGVAGHFGLAAEPDDPGYLGQFAVTREVSAVTGACLALRREIYDAVGGLNEEQLPISFNDVDFCLRIRAKGFRIIWTPFARLYHLESATRGLAENPERIAQSAREADYMRHQWGTTLDQDPFYNPAFDRRDHSFKLASSPRIKKQWRCKTDQPAESS